MNYISYVNIKQGTESVPGFSNGNTLALTQRPFGMNSFTLMTRSNSGNWFYHPKDRTLEGIRLTHQPSPWIGDYGPLIMSMQREMPYFTGKQRYSGFRPDETVLMPHYMKVSFLRYQSQMELVPTERAAILRLMYHGDQPAAFCIFTEDAETNFVIEKEKRLVSGYTKYSSWKTAEEFATYFAYSFDCDLDMEHSTFMTRKGEFIQGNSITEEQCGIYLRLTSKEVTLRMATSYISVEQAILNLKQEVSEQSFEQVKQKAEDNWEDYLSRIEIETEDEDQKRTFYSCMYRLFLFPRKFYEYDQFNHIIHRCADTGKIAPGVKYVDNGFWDTFRTVYPLLSLIAPKQYAEIVEGYVNTYKDCGWLPKWASPSEVGMMPGTLIDGVIADAAVKNILGIDLLKEAFEGVMKHATQESEDSRYGRHGTKDYQKYGYIPREKYRECVNHTLDYVYGDFCIAQIAHVLGFEDVNEQFMKSSRNYSLIFDESTGLMRGRDEEGNMAVEFDEFGWGGEYCEGGPWQNSFGIYHDINELAKLHGGKEKLMRMMDQLFETPPYYSVGGYGTEIHEMTEMAAVDFGQCAISNQPSFHLPYIYAALGNKEKSEYWVSKMAKELFSWKDDGFPGDEDNGTMAGWYIFGTLGLYPICPGKAEYIKIKPLIRKAVLHMEDRDYVITEAEEHRIYIPHEEIVKG